MIPKASDYIDVRNTERPDKKRLKEFKKSEKYKQYLKDYDDQHKKYIRQKRIDWAWEKGLPLFNTLLALIAAIAGIISILLQLNLI